MKLRRVSDPSRSSAAFEDGSKQAGFSLLEIMVALGVLVLILVAVASVLLSIHAQQRQALQVSAVQRASVSLIEEMKAADPRTIDDVYHGNLYSVPGVDGALASGSALEVVVDATIPELVVVRVHGEWLKDGVVQVTDSMTEFFSREGQILAAQQP